MEAALTLIKTTRKNFTEVVESLTLDQLNKVPECLNNNIIWNYAHNIVTQQILCYKLAGLEPKISSELIDKYRKGTKPESVVTLVEIEELKKLSVDCIIDLEEDLKNNVFSGFKPYATSYGFELKNIEDAVAFLPVHEGLHLGYAMALRKLVQIK